MMSQSLIIVFFDNPLDFVCDYNLQTCLELAKKNKVIAFLWEDAKSFKELFIDWIKNHKKPRFIWKKNKVIFFQPIHIIPFRRLQTIKELNFFINIFFIKLVVFLLIVKSHFKNKIVWIFDPKFFLIPKLFINWLRLYDCVDYISSINPLEDKTKKRKEIVLIDSVNAVFTNSPALFKLKKSFHPKVFQVPQGCNINLFLETKTLGPIKEFNKIPEPRIGFIGNIDHRLYFQLIADLAFRNPNWSFIFVGPILIDYMESRIVKLKKNIEILRSIRNIYFFPKISKEKIIHFIDNFNLGFIPYNCNQEFNKYCYPMKVFEYFARGKPVIATPIESLLPLKPYIKIINSTKEVKKISSKIAKIIKDGWPKGYQEEQKELALANSWEKKIEKISNILKKEFPERFKD